MRTPGPTDAISRRLALALTVGLAFTGCALETSSSPSTSPEPTSRQPAPTSRQPTASSRPVDPAQAQRLQQVMTPLIKAMDHPIPLDQVKVGIMDDSHINAANAGGGEFYVTTGLLEKADDNHLRAVLAHETAHADLGHVTKLQTLGAGLNVGMVLLDQIIPGSRALAPIAGELVARAYTRKEEYQADAHGVDILKRAGYDGKALMVDTLTWLQRTEGASGGGFFATHPGTADRIQAVQRLR
jgi:predicted Zn-dependent protease